MDVTLNMKFLEHCEPGELVRAHFGLKVEWGIVADRLQQKRVVVISGNNAPWYLDPQGAVLSCLSYGREYDLLPESPCCPGVRLMMLKRIICTEATRSSTPTVGW